MLQRSSALLLAVVTLIVGAAAFLLIEDVLGSITENWKLIFGPMLVLIVLFARGGLIGIATTLKRKLGRG